MALNFYAALPKLNDLSEITDIVNYHPVPEDWVIALTDVRGSTKAIEAGKYKDVNSIAAASITAMLNQIPDVDLPFVFGGDGATILIPPQVVNRAQEALIATRDLAKAAFNLELRVGIVPVRDVLNDGYTIQVAKLRMSANFQQAVFTGGGLSHAETLLKKHGDQYEIRLSGKYQADFSGFECRWREVASKYEETISLMVMATSTNTSSIYNEVLRKITEIYGDRATRHPITTSNLHLATYPEAFRTEAIIKYGDTGWRRLLRFAYFNLLARLAMRYNLKGWGVYKSLLVGSTDHEKFDDTLRLTMSGTAKQREILRIYLETKRQRGEVVYGISTSESALVTCIVFDHFGRQVHFVDGASGGYALAAKEMKMQLQQRETSR